jgi:peptidoglycan/LPS O-acetylase OafA/YrhL
MTNNNKVNIMINSVTQDPKNNAFDFMRLMLAIFVVYGHSRYLYGAEDLLHWQAKGFEVLHIGGISVWGFFVISGYLVTTSWLNSKGLVDFLTKRFKRIFPGYWASLLVCAFFFAPLWYYLQFKTTDQFLSLNALNIWNFLSSNLLSVGAVNSIGGVAIDQVNGPLWTIPHEIHAYIMLGVIGCAGVISVNASNFFKKWFILAVTILLTAARITYTYNADFANFYALWFGDERFLLFLAIFFWGVSLNLYKQLFPVNYCGLFLSFVGLVVGTLYDILPILLPFCFSYFIIALSFLIPVKNISKKIGDLSYGIYLYHWPIRLTLQMYGLLGVMSLWSFVALNLALTIPFALFSWNFVEKRWLQREKQKDHGLDLSFLRNFKWRPQQAEHGVG